MQPPSCIPEAPEFFRWQTDDERQKRIQFYLHCSLRDMHGHLRDFWHAITVFDHAYAASEVLPPGRVYSSSWHAGWMYQGWLFLACRDGAQSIYHFRKSMDAANGHLFRLPPFSDICDRALLGQANDVFSAAFPDFEKMRHAVAHAGELLRSERAIEENSFKKPIDVPGLLNVSNPESLVGAPGGLVGRTFHASIAGEMYNYELSQTSLETLCEVYRLFVSAIHTPND
jgi:hypothetical protein